MRFDRRHKPTPYLNRRDQHRMLGLVGLLALVMVLFQSAGARLMQRLVS